MVTLKQLKYFHDSLNIAFVLAPGREFLFIYLFIYLSMNVYTGYNLAVKDAICIIYNKIY